MQELRSALSIEEPWKCKREKNPLTCDIVEASFVQQPRKELQANDGVNDNDKEYQKGNVQQGYHGHQDGV